MAQRIGADGEIVIPREIRDEVGLRPGTAVELVRDGEGVLIVRAGTTLTRQLRGRYDSSGLAAALLADRARE